MQPPVSPPLNAYKKPSSFQLQNSLFRRPLVSNGTDFNCVLPWLVSLRDSEGKHACGGSLIAPTIVLTAAHCLKFGLPPSVDIGRIQREGEDGSEFETRVPVRKIVHEKYNSDIRENNDIALLVLDVPSTKPIASLAARHWCFETLRGCEVLLLGWGLTEEGSSPAQVLQGAFTRSVRTSVCKATYTAITGSFLISSSMICAGDEERDTCIYDSGGPLILRSQVVGIVSWGSAVCGDSRLPGVYTSVPRLRSWLDAKLEELSIRLEP